MKNRKIIVIIVTCIICATLLFIVGAGGAALFGLKLLSVLKNQVRINIEIAGNDIGGDEGVFFDWPENKEENESATAEPDVEPKTEEQTGEIPDNLFPGDEFGGDYSEEYGEDGDLFGDFGAFGGDSDLAEALKNGLPAQDESANPFLKEDFKSHLGTNHVNHERDEFSGNYYENICDSIDYSVDYGIERKYYEYLDEEKNTTVQISCVQLTGDIPGIETLNKNIYLQTIDFAMIYSYQSDSAAEPKKLIQVDSYITYNDDTTMSIILDELYETSSGRYMDLYDMNLNLATGTLMQDNILKVDDAFVKEFRRRSVLQNGEENPGLDKLDDDMLLNYLKNEFTNVIFYTPMGMEIGVNYEVNNTVGWVTVTFKDYEKYLNAV